MSFDVLKVDLGPHAAQHVKRTSRPPFWVPSLISRRGRGRWSIAEGVEAGRAARVGSPTRHRAARDSSWAGPARSRRRCGGPAPAAGGRWRPGAVQSACPAAELRAAAPRARPRPPAPCVAGAARRPRPYDARSHRNQVSRRFAYWRVRRAVADRLSSVMFPQHARRRLALPSPLIGRRSGPVAGSQQAADLVQEPPTLERHAPARRCAGFQLVARATEPDQRHAPGLRARPGVSAPPPRLGALQRPQHAARVVEVGTRGGHRIKRGKLSARVGRARPPLESARRARPEPPVTNALGRVVVAVQQSRSTYSPVPPTSIGRRPRATTSATSRARRAPPREATR